MVLPGSITPHDVVLHDGVTITVRPITPDDRDGLNDFHERCSERTHYLRFFSSRPHLHADMLDRFVNVDHDNRDAIVAVVEREIVGVARYDRLDDATAAEVAFVVEDRYQGRGIATVLLHELAAAAVERGVREFRAITLSENVEMRHVFRHSGYKVTTRRQPNDPAVIEYAFPIGSGR